MSMAPTIAGRLRSNRRNASPHRPWLARGADTGDWRSTVPPSQAYRMRGLMKAYITSTARFTTRKMRAKMRIVDWTMK